MEAKSIVREVAALPPEARQQIIDFVAFLKARYSRVPAARKSKPTELAKEPFVGMWKTRRDLQDSQAWVRSLRQCEWGAGKTVGR